MYRDTLKTLKRKFGQPQAVVLSLLILTNRRTTLQLNCTALIKSSIFPQLFRVLVISSGLCPMVQIFRVHHSWIRQFKNCNQIWRTTMLDLICPTMLDFNDWLKERAEGQDCMKTIVLRSKPEDTNRSGAIKTDRSHLVLVDSLKFQRMIAHLGCLENHNIRSWDGRFSRKKFQRSVQLAKENQLCFSCLNGKHSFCMCQNQSKCNREGSRSTHNILLHGAERIFPKRPEQSGQNRKRPEQIFWCIATNSQLSKSVNNSWGQCKHSRNKQHIRTHMDHWCQGFSTGPRSLSRETVAKCARAPFLCDTACSHSWIFSEVAKHLHLWGKPFNMTVNGINTQETISTETVQVKITPIGENTCSPFELLPYVKNKTSALGLTKLISLSCKINILLWVCYLQRAMTAQT